jgi:hypothetical protein
VTKSSLGTENAYEQASGQVRQNASPATPRGGATCDLYEPGHQIHYKHQGDAVHSPSRAVRDVLLDGPLIRLTLDDGSQLLWRHHDPERLSRIVELLRGKCVIYPEYHAMRVGPYWFNCATETDDWRDCRVTGKGLTGS